MRLIDADELKKKAFSDPDTTMSGEALVYVQDIDEAPTIEAEPMRHGRWIWKGNDKGYFCSECGSGCLLDMDSDWFKSEGCPHCRAKMDLEVNDG